MSLEFDGANNKISNSSGASYGVALPAPNYRQPQPLIINGNMAVAQRSTSVASITASGYNTLDRYRCVIVTAGTWTQSQDTDVPTGSGFATSMKWDCTTADASLGASDLITIQQFVEGQNVQYLKKGTSDAVPITLSFWVKSVLTGTYICEIGDSDNSRSISQAYTISDASTWEYKTLNFPGDTTGAFTNDNGASLTVQFCLGAGTDYTSGSLATSWGTTTTANRYVGQVNLANSTSNNFWITGVQLEVGEFNSTTLPPFQHESYGDNLERCQRYYEKSFLIGTTPAASAVAPDGNIFSSWDTNTARMYINFKKRKRANPTITVYRGNNAGTGTATGTANFIYSGAWNNHTCTGSVSQDYGASLTASSTANFGTDSGVVADLNWTLDAEL